MSGDPQLNSKGCPYRSDGLAKGAARDVPGSPEREARSASSAAGKLPDERARSIVDAACAGINPAEDDISYLLGFDEQGPEAAYALAAAREIGWEACGGHGHLFAQIGVDQLACPERCAFCAFSAGNVDGTTYDRDQAVVPLERIVHYARLFDSLGVRLISLMATAALGFDRYAGIIRAVRTAVPERTRIMANAGDITEKQARGLREAGADAAYHSIRLGEGIITSIDPETRRTTLRNLKAAGFDLMTGIEPVWEGVDHQMLAARICEIARLRPFAMGACTLTPVEGADVGGRVPASTAFVRYVAALARLVCGSAVPIGGIGGVAWVDAGTDPRKRNYGSSDEAIARDISRARARLEAAGFVLP